MSPQHSIRSRMALSAFLLCLLGAGISCKSSAPSARPETEATAPAPAQATSPPPAASSTASSAPQATASSDQASPTSAADTRSQTGYDLYSWRGPGTWFFSLLPGMNRLRSTDEVKAQATAIDGISALKTRLRQLERGSKVVWTANVPGTELPTTELVSDLSAFTAQHGIELSVKQ